MRDSSRLVECASSVRFAALREREQRHSARSCTHARVASRRSKQSCSACRSREATSRCASIGLDHPDRSARGPARRAQAEYPDDDEAFRLGPHPRARVSGFAPTPILRVSHASHRTGGRDDGVACASARASMDSLDLAIMAALNLARDLDRRAGCPDEVSSVAGTDRLRAAQPSGIEGVLRGAGPRLLAELPAADRTRVSSMRRSAASRWRQSRRSDRCIVCRRAGVGRHVQIAAHRSCALPRVRVGAASSPLYVSASTDEVRRGRAIARRRAGQRSHVSLLPRAVARAVLCACAQCRRVWQTLRARSLRRCAEPGMASRSVRGRVLERRSGASYRAIAFDAQRRAARAWWRPLRPGDSQPCMRSAAS